jgi:hypothetical protein
MSAAWMLTQKSFDASILRRCLRGAGRCEAACRLTWRSWSSRCLMVARAAWCCGGTALRLGRS